MQQKNLPPDWDAIGRYLAGESEPAEVALVRAWLDANPLDRELVARMADATAAPAAENIDVDAALARVHARLATERTPNLTLERGGSRTAPGDRKRALTLVAGALAAAAVFAAISLRSLRHGVGTSSGHVLAYSTGVGRRDSVELADGSRVVLGPSTRLVVPANYGSANRDVQLDGDAYFDVRHDASKPFAVRSSNAVIEDIGTTFTVESDPNSTTSVAVLTGSVRLRAQASSANDGVVLAAGDRGLLDAAGHASVERQTVHSDDASWTKGTLQFRDAPLDRVVAELHRWYGITLQVPDSALLARHVTATISGEPIDQVLNILGLTLGARIDRHGDTAIVSAARGSTGAR